MENMIINPPPKAHHSATRKALLSSSKGALFSKAGFYHFNPKSTDETMLHVQRDHNTCVDESSLRCVFLCEGNGKPSQDLSLSLSSANPSDISLQSSELRFPREYVFFQKLTDQIQQNHHDHHNRALQEGYFGKSTNFTPYAKGKLLAMVKKVFVVLLLTIYIGIVESTLNGSANEPAHGKDSKHEGGHRGLSELEKALIILAVLVGCFILIVSALCIYIRWTKRLPRLGIRQIESFPLVRFPLEEGTVGYGISVCEICLDDFTDGVDLRLLPSCGHIFHTDCVLIWLHKHHAICPVCRYDYNVTV